MAFFNKLNAAERLAAIGAVIVIIAWLVTLVGGYGLGGSSITLLGAIAVLVIYFLKYSPTQNMTWPAPIQTIVLIISAIAAILALLAALSVIGLLGAFGGGLGLYFLGLVATAVGAVIMVWGAWQDYQAMPKTTPPSNPPV
ncbi:MAG TPA: hypothetical protein VGC90_06940 [Candidatus Limnocylindrales bacterium]